MPKAARLKCLFKKMNFGTKITIKLIPILIQNTTFFSEIFIFFTLLKYD